MNRKIFCPKIGLAKNGKIFNGPDADQWPKILIAIKLNSTIPRIKLEFQTEATVRAVLGSLFVTQENPFYGQNPNRFFLPDKIKIHFLWSVSLFKVNLKSGKESFNGNQSRINMRSQPLEAVHFQFIDFILTPTL